MNNALFKNNASILEIISFNSISYWRSELLKTASLKYWEKDWQSLIESSWGWGGEIERGWNNFIISFAHPYHFYFEGETVTRQDEEKGLENASNSTEHGHVLSAASRWHHCISRTRLLWTGRPITGIQETIQNSLMALFPKVMQSQVIWYVAVTFKKGWVGEGGVG